MILDKVKEEENYYLLFEKLKTGIAVFAHENFLIIEKINQSALDLLQIEKRETPIEFKDWGPYRESLKALLSTKKNNYLKQLTGVLGKPVSATLHVENKSFEQKKLIIELTESFETKMGETSHELRRPLTNVKSLVDTLHLWGAGEDPEVRPKFLGQLYKEVERLSKLIDELLDLSKMQAGTSNLKTEQIALKNLVQETISDLKNKAKESNVELINLVPDNFVLKADLNKIFHVVQNLIENGIRYNKKGGKVIISVNSEKTNSFTVEDTGIGIPKDKFALIFERFKRLNKNISGTGLGLAIVKSIVDLHGGQIEIFSEEKKGSKFIVTIPNLEEENFPIS